MPQMKPMNWFYLFILFCLTLFMNILLNFFLKNFYLKKNEKNKINFKSFNWKW